MYTYDYNTKTIYLFEADKYALYHAYMNTQMKHIQR